VSCDKCQRVALLFWVSWQSWCLRLLDLQYLAIVCTQDEAVDALVYN
jgi:hypothetical protein